MKITIEAKGGWITGGDGGKLRVWEGVTGGGIKVRVLVLGIIAQDDSKLEELKQEMSTIPNLDGQPFKYGQLRMDDETVQL